MFQTKEPLALSSHEITSLSIAFLLLLILKLLLAFVVMVFSRQFFNSTFLSVVSTWWDSHYFVWIAEHGYPAGNFWQTPQFYYFAYMPAYPSLITLLSYITHDALVSAFLLSNMFYFFTLIAFFFVARRITPNRAVTTTFLFGLFPLFATYGFFSYSDTVYLCFAVTSWYFFAKQDYAKSGLVAGLAAATRVLGILLTPIYFALILYAHWKNKLKIRKPMLLLVGPVIAYCLISVYFFSLSGNPFAIVDAESKWGVTLSGPVNLMSLLYRPSMFIFPMEFEVSIARLFYLSFFLIAAITVRKISRQLAFYGLSFMLFIVNLSGYSVFSEPRYALAAWPVFLLFSNVKERETIILIAVAGILLTLQSVAYHLTTFWT